MSQGRMETKYGLMSSYAIYCFPTSLNEMQPLPNRCTCSTTQDISGQSIKKKNVPQDCPSKGKTDREFIYPSPVSSTKVWPMEFNFPAFLSCIEWLPAPEEARTPALWHDGHSCPEMLGGSRDSVHQKHTGALPSIPTASSYI